MAPGAEELVPGGQLLHADTSEAPELLLKVAGGQAVQAAREAAAVELPYVPEGHGTHCAAPGVSL